MLTANKIIKVIIISLIYFVSLMPAESLADKVLIPHYEADEATYIGRFIEKAKQDPFLLFAAQYIQKTYMGDLARIKKYEPGIVGTTLADARAEWNRLTDTGVSDFDKFNSVLGGLPVLSKLIGDPGIAEASFRVYEAFFAPVIKARLNRSHDVLDQSLQYKWFEATRTTEGISILKDVYHWSLIDSRLRDSIDQQFASILACKIGDKAETIPGFSKIPGELKPDGFEVDPAELKELLGNQNDQFMALNKKNIQFLSELKEDQQVLLDWVNNEPARRAAEQKAQQLEQEYEQLKDQAPYSAVYLISTFVGFADPKAGHDLAVLGYGSLQVSRGIEQITQATAKWGSDLEAIGWSNIVGTGNIVGGIMQIVSLFSDQGPTPDEIIIDQLKAISGQINDLRTEMHDRFDRIDAGLNIIYNELGQIEWTVEYLRDRVVEIQETLFEIQVDLQKMQRDLYSFLDAGFRRDFQLNINNYLSYRYRTGIDMSYQPQFTEAEAYFRTWATYSAHDPLSSGAANRDFSALGTYNELNNYPLEFNINYLSKYPKNVFRLAELYEDKDGLANPMDLATATHAWIDLMKENPSYARYPNAEYLNVYYDQIRDELVKLQSAISRISKNNYSSNLFNALIQNYASKVVPVQQAIQAIENTYTQQLTIPIKIWRGPDQSISYTLTINPINACDGKALNLELPNTWQALFPISPNRYLVAEYLKLGKIKLCISTQWNNIKRYVRSGMFVFDGSLDSRISMYYEGDKIRLTFSARDIKTPVTCETYEFKPPPGA